MHKIEGSAQYPTVADAQQAAARLAGLRHDDSNDIVGGAHDVHENGDGTAVLRFCYRIRQGTSVAQVKKIGKVLEEALGDADAEPLNLGNVEYDESQYVDRDTNQVITEPSNRVVQVVPVLDDEGRETGETRERTLISTARYVKAVDDETGEVIGRVAVRKVTDADTGEQVVFEGDQGDADPNVTVDLSRP